MADVLTTQKPVFLRPRMQLVSPVCGSIIAAVGLLVLLGWAVDSDVLKRIEPSFVAMNPASAIAFVIAGLSLIAHSLGNHRWQFALASKIGATVVLGLGLTRVIGYCTAWDPGLDHMLFREQLELARLQTGYINRMAPNSAVLFTLVGASLLLLNLKRPRRALPHEWPAFAVVLISLFAFLGYVLGASQMYGIGAFIPMALHTAMCFLTIGIGLLMVRPDRGMMAILMSRNLGGVVARRLLPGAIVITFLLSWLRWTGQRNQLFETEVGVSLMAAGSIALFSAMVWWCAAILNRVDQTRESAERALQETNIHLEKLVEERTAELRNANEMLQQEVAERTAAQNMLARQAAALKRSNQELEQFAYVASHDLQEPLRMVGSYLQLLERRYKSKLDETACEFIGFAVDGANRMKQLINDLLEYSRVDRKGREFVPVECKDIVQDALSNLHVAVAEAHAEVTIDDLPTVVADAAQLRQVFQNLIGNAIKFRCNDRPSLIHIGAKLIDNYWHFTVTDNGIGIDPQYATRVFVVFQRLHSREEYPGTGIGLAICKKIVERHGGRIWVEPVTEGGSQFIFTIPLREAASHEQKRAA